MLQKNGVAPSQPQSKLSDMAAAQVVINMIDQGPICFLYVYKIWGWGQNGTTPGMELYTKKPGLY